MPAAIFLNYHAINDVRFPERCHRDPRFSLPRDRFVKQLRIIESESRPIISLHQAITGASGVVLTFDDGHPADQLTTWALLQEHGVEDKSGRVVLVNGQCWSGALAMDVSDLPPAASMLEWSDAKGAAGRATFVVAR